MIQLSCFRRRFNKRDTVRQTKKTLTTTKLSGRFLVWEPKTKRPQSFFGARNSKEAASSKGLISFFFEKTLLYGFERRAKSLMASFTTCDEFLPLRKRVLFTFSMRSSPVVFGIIQYVACIRFVKVLLRHKKRCSFLVALPVSNSRVVEWMGHRSFPCIRFSVCIVPEVRYCRRAFQFSALVTDRCDNGSAESSGRARDGVRKRSTSDAM